MRKCILSIMVALTIIFMVGCGGANNQAKTENEPKQETKQEATDTKTVADPDEETAEKPKETHLTPKELSNELKKQEVRLIEVEPYVSYDDGLTAGGESPWDGRPDSIIVDIANDTGKDIKGIAVMFVAWDENGLPLPICMDGELDMTEDYTDEFPYIGASGGGAANIKAHSTWGEHSFDLDISFFDSYVVDKVKGIVAYYKTFDGEEWTNPLLDEWEHTYDNVLLKSCQ